MSTGACHELITANQNWLSEVIASYDNDTTAQSIIQGISIKDDKFKQYSYVQGLIKDNSRIYVRQTGDISYYGSVMTVHTGAI